MRVGDGVFIGLGVLVGVVVGAGDGVCVGVGDGVVQLLVSKILSDSSFPDEK